MAYQTILTEVEDRVGTIRLNRPEALNALNSQLLDELGEALTAMDASPRVGRSSSPARRGPSPPAPTSRRWRRRLRRDVRRGPLRRPGRDDHALPQADHRRGRRLLPRRRLRARDALRLHHRRRHRPVRPARGQPRRHARHRRHPAPDPLRRQVEGDGDVPDRADDGRRRGRALRPGQPRGAGRRTSLPRGPRRRRPRSPASRRSPSARSRRRSTAATRRRCARGSSSSGGSSTPSSPPRTRPREWPPSPRSAPRSSAANDPRTAVDSGRPPPLSEPAPESSPIETKTSWPTRRHPRSAHCRPSAARK